MLQDQKSKAIKANQDIEEYLWKIKLTEQASQALKRERAMQQIAAWLLLNLGPAEVGYESG